MTEPNHSQPPEASDRPSRFPWPPVLLAATVLAALALDRWLLRLPLPFAETETVHFLGMLVLLGGGVLVVWGTLQFHRHETSIRPDRGANVLMATGPYAFSRNPIYLGEAIAMIGAGVTFNRLWLVLAAPVFAYAVTQLAIEREEAYLQRRFGVAYRDYMARVRRWI